MSLPASRFEEVPEETARIARRAFRKASLYMRMRDALGQLYADDDFADLFPTRGQPAESPWRLALVSVMQFSENLSDRQAAEAVRARIDWKYALCLELDDAGFDYSVLSEFRSRLVHEGAERLLFERMLSHFQAAGLVKAGGRQRTDATHVLAAIHPLNRIELVGRTLQAVLEEVAREAPSWLKAQVTPDWFERYSRQIEASRLPKAKAEQRALAEQIGRDGAHLLARLEAEARLATVAQAAIVATLRQVWQQEYELTTDGLRWREQADLSSSSERIVSPFETEARCGVKRETVWLGYKVHLTESCDEALPHLITQVETTVATTSDYEALTPIQADLAQRRLLPSEQLVDKGYASAEALAHSQREHGINLLCPVQTDPQWQARSADGLSLSDFRIDWEQQQVRCPQGHVSRHWTLTDQAHKPLIRVQFRRQDCQPCPVRDHCTHGDFRQLGFAPQPLFFVLQQARQRQQTPEFWQRYAIRAGIEGTISQAVNSFGARRSRYLGQAKTHLHNLLTATALNLQRVLAWLDGASRARTRSSHFAALAS